MATNQNRSTRQKKYNLKEKQEDVKGCLRNSEINLCNELGLDYREYLLIKEILVRESILQGYITRGFVEQCVKIEKDKTLRVFDFLVEHDLIIQK